MRTYRLKVHREGNWWIVGPPRGRLRARARTLADVEGVGTRLVVDELGMDPESFKLDITVVTPADIAKLIDTADRAEYASRIQAERASEARRAAAQELKDIYDVSVADLARLFHVNRGRVYQILDDSPIPATCT